MDLNIASYTAVCHGDHFVTESKSGVHIAVTELVDGCWETLGRMLHSHELRFPAKSAAESITMYLRWGGYLRIEHRAE
jgi:hypothetical protein